MKKIFTASFWIVMTVHVVVFTLIGLFTDRGWKMLIIFVSLFVPTVLIKAAVTAYARRNPDKKRLRRLLGIAD